MKIGGWIFHFFRLLSRQRIFFYINFLANNKNNVGKHIRFFFLLFSKRFFSLAPSPSRLREQSTLLDCCCFFVWLLLGAWHSHWTIGSRHQASSLKWLICPSLLAMEMVGRTSTETKKSLIEMRSGKPHTKVWPTPCEFHSGTLFVQSTLLPGVFMPFAHCTLPLGHRSCHHSSETAANTIIENKHSSFLLLNMTF